MSDVATDTTWNPVSEPPDSCNYVWVKWISNGFQKTHVSICYWDERKFLRVQTAEDNADHNDPTFGYIGEVVGWKPLKYPSP